MDKEPNCHVTPIVKVPTQGELASTQAVRLMVSGMGCINCAARVHNGLISLAGVAEVSVDHLAGTADIVYNPRLVSPDSMLAAVARAGNDGRHSYRATFVI